MRLRQSDPQRRRLLWLALIIRRQTRVSEDTSATSVNKGQRTGYKRVHRQTYLRPPHDLALYPWNRYSIPALISPIVVIVTHFWANEIQTQVVLRPIWVGGGGGFKADNRNWEILCSRTQHVIYFLFTYLPLCAITPRLCRSTSGHLTRFSNSDALMAYPFD